MWFRFVLCLAFWYFLQTQFGVRVTTAFQSHLHVLLFPGFFSLNVWYFLYLVVLSSNYAQLMLKWMVIIKEEVLVCVCVGFLYTSISRLAPLLSQRPHSSGMSNLLLCISPCQTDVILQWANVWRESTMEQSFISWCIHIKPTAVSLSIPLSLSLGKRHP